MGMSQAQGLWPSPRAVHGTPRIFHLFSAKGDSVFL